MGQSLSGSFGILFGDVCIIGQNLSPEDSSTPLLKDGKDGTFIHWLPSLIG